MRVVLPLTMVDNSSFPPTRLTIPLGPAYPSLYIGYPFSSIQAARILMAFHVFLFLLLFFLILSLARLWRLYLPHYCHPHSSAEMMRTTFQRLLKPRTPLDCPACRLTHTLSSDVGLAPRPVRPWCEVKSRRGATKRLNTAGFACPNHLCWLLVVSVGQNRPVRTPQAVSCSLPIPQRKSTISSIDSLIFTEGKWTLCTGFSPSSRG